MNRHRAPQRRHDTRLGALTMLRRQLATDRGAAVLLAVGAALVSAVLVAGPRAGAQVVAADLADQLAVVGAAQRDPSVQRTWLPGRGTTEDRRSDTRTGEQVLAGVVEDLTAARDAAGSDLRPALGTPRAVMTRGRAPVDKGPRADDIHAMTLALRADAELPALTDVVAGRLPEPYPAEVARSAIGDPSALQDAPVLEVALMSETAERMRWEVGERRALADLALPVTVELVGILRPRDAGLADWAHLPSTLVPLVVEDGDVGTFVHGVAYTDPSAVPLLLIPTGVTLDAWIPLDVGTLAGADRAEVLPQLRALLAETRGRSELTRVLPRSAERGATTSAYVAVLTAGPTGAALGVVALTGALSAVRRRRTVEVARARGAGATSLASGFAAQVAVVTVPAAVTAAVLVHLVTATAGGPGPSGLISGGPLSGGLGPALLTGLVVGAVPALLTGVSALAASTRAADRSAESRPGRLRSGAAAAVVALAAAAVLTLSRTGLAGAGGDVLVLATPVLVGAAGAVLTAGALPPLLRVLSRRLRAGRGLPHLLGSALAARSPVGGPAAVLALVLAVAMVTFSALTWTTVRTGIADTAATATGADVRLAGGLRAEDLEAVRALPGVREVAVVREVDDWTLTTGRSPARVAVLTVDADALARVQADLPGPSTWEVGDLVPASGDGGGAALPVLVPTEVDPGNRELALRSGTTDVQIRTTGTPGLHGVTTGTSWVVVDEATWARAAPRAQGSVAVALVALTPGADHSEVTREITAALPAGVGVGTADQAAQRLRAAPLVRGMEWLLLAATVLSALLVATTVLLAAAAGRPARRRLLELLHVLGAPARVERSLLAWELGPLLAGTLVGGTAAGVALTWVVQRAADLRLLTGATTVPALGADPPTLAVVAAVVVAPLALAATASYLLTSASAHRRSPGTALREGDDQ